jgi:hypothetical protein
MLVAIVLAALAAPAAKAKEPCDLRVCGPGGCASVEDVTLVVHERGTWFHPAPRPAPYYVRFAMPPNVYYSGTEGTILYLPSRAIWRVRIDGVRLWLDVPRHMEMKLHRAVRGLRPFAAPARWPR